METDSMFLTRRWLKPLLLMVLLVLTCGGITTGILGMVMSPLNTGNQEYLDRSIKDTTHLMIPVAVAKGAADIIEGSTIDVEAGVVIASAGMSIEAGDTLQPILEYINLAWRMLLLSMIYLVAAKTILTGAIHMAEPVLAISLAAYLLNSLLPRSMPEGHPLRQGVLRIAALFLLVSLLFVLILPLTISGAACLSRHTTDPLRQEVFASFDRTAQAFSFEGLHDKESLKDRATFLKEKFMEIGRHSKDATVDISTSVCKLAVIKLLNGIVFPLASLAFLIWLVRGCLYPALGLNDHSLTARDLKHLSRWLTQRERGMSAENVSH